MLSKTSKLSRLYEKKQNKTINLLYTNTLSTVLNMMFTLTEKKNRIISLKPFNLIIIIMVFILVLSYLIAVLNLI